MNKSKALKNVFYQGAIWLTVSALILKVIGLIYKIPLSYLLGDEGMGYFNSAYTVYTFFYIISTAGIPKAISIMVAKSEAENRNTADLIFKSAFRIFFFIGLILLFVFVALGSNIASFIGNSKSLFSMYAIAPSVLFVCAGGVVRGYFSGKMRFAPIAVSELISGISKLFFGLLFAHVSISASKSLPEICAYTILGITIGSFLSLIYLMLIYSLTRTKDPMSIKISSKKTISDVLKIAIPITFASAIGSVVNILDLTFIMKGLNKLDYTSTLSAALYGNYTTLAVPMFSLVSTLITPISTAMMPMLTKNISQMDKEEYSANISKALGLTSFISIPAALFFAFFSRNILLIIFEEGSAVLASSLLSLLAPGILFLGPLTVINTALESAGKIGISVFSMAFGAIVKLLVSIALIQNADIGILAAPIGTSVSYMISLMISSMSLKKIRGVRFSVLRESFRPFIISSAALIITLLAERFIGFTDNLRVHGVGIVGIYVSAYLLFSALFQENIRNCLFKCVKINKNV